ncbi:TRAP transporter substrate-binding protein [Flavobacterium orientale]|uniref:C4-dicarboxylate ABC transporter substrate-binding protein n=1 Tax=Flavobacterium orientale TaxID=1756020 RepID=A0A917DBF5_9FLAO|nr:TRAP transporter substrate-binding protein [Flavobacterium orientale]GGD23632.1 C4-dicarboxylate ABC transporter substrate-binding protein [Flavobacterium orientale]
MKLKSTILLSFLMLLTFNQCAEISQTKTLKLAHGLDVSHSVHLAMVKMGEDLAAISGNKIKLEIYPNQQLGTERECIELLQIGSLDMTKVSVGVLENFAPKMKVFGLPFLFRDRQHSFSVLDGPVGKELLDEGLEYWIKGLGYYDAGSRSFYTKTRPIDSPSDLKGMKIRVMESPTAYEMIKSFGGSPTPISWGELYTSLQQGVVDGAENNPPSFYLSRHYEVCKFYSIDEHTVLPDVLIIGTNTWNRFTKEEQAWIQQAVDNSVVHQRKLWKIAEQEALDEVIKAGVQVSYPDKTKFRATVNGIYERVKQDKKMARLVMKIQETK